VEGRWTDASETWKNWPELWHRSQDQVAQLGERVAGVESRLGVVESRLGVVESQIVQLRTDLSDGFSATKEELREDIAAIGREMTAQFVRAGNETRVLHEDLVGRISRLSEGRWPSP